MKGITPCLWFDNQAEDAARFYTSIFKNSRLGTISRYGKSGSQASGRPEGSVMMVEFEIAGQRLQALNGGPVFKLTEAVSLVINCENQREIDEYWARLTEGGSESVCGWLKDKYGLSWQVVPTVMGEIMRENDPQKLERVMAALMTMKKIDLGTLTRAAEGKETATAGAAH